MTIIERLMEQAQDLIHEGNEYSAFGKTYRLAESQEVITVRENKDPLSERIYAFKNRKGEWER